jgi:release factor glutamine methyltransferase
MYGMDVKKIMRLIDFKHHVQDKLYSIYNQNECDVIFYELIENFLGISKINYLVDMEHLILDSEILILNQKINQLKSNEPLQYVIGNKKIFGINFKLNDSALIPRPETEELCSWILSHILNNIKILDIGTGSGLIALVLKKHVKNSKVDGWDNSIKALNLAKSNAKKNNINVNFKLNDIFKKDIPKNEYDLIVSNPPYVSYDDYNKIHQRVKKYEPNNAIFVNDNDILIFYKIIIKKASISLRKNGYVFFECNEKNIEYVFNILKYYRFKNIEIKKDFRGKKRMIKAQK